MFWAIIGGLGASLLLPAMQSLIHGNFEGAAQKRVYALVGAAAAIAAAVGPLIGGFITTFLSWRLAFLGEVGVIAVVLSGIGLVKDVPYHRIAGRSTSSAASCRCWAWAASCWGSHHRRAASRSALLLVGGAALGCSPGGSSGRKGRGQAALIDPDLFRSKLFRFGISGQMLQQIALGGTTMIVLPIYLQMVFEYRSGDVRAGLSLAPLSLSMFAVAILAGRRAGHRPASSIIRAGFTLLTLGLAILVPIVPRADSGLYLVIPLVIAGSGWDYLVSPAQQLHARADHRGARPARRPGSTRRPAPSVSSSGWRSPARSCWPPCSARSSAWPRRAACSRRPSSNRWRRS